MGRKRIVIGAVVACACIVSASALAIMHGGARAGATGSYAITGLVSSSNASQVANVTVTATEPDSSTVVFGPVTTNSNGNYTLYVDAGTYDFHFDPSSGSGYYPDVQRGVTVTGDMELDEQLTLITNSFYGALTDQYGNPIANATVTVSGGHNGHYGQATTGSSGSFSVQLVPDTYNYVSVNEDDSDTIQFSTIHSLGQFDLTNGSINQNLKVSLATLTITAKDQDGNPSGYQTAYVNGYTNNTTPLLVGTTNQTSGAVNYVCSNNCVVKIPVGTTFDPSTTETIYADSGDPAVPYKLCAPLTVNQDITVVLSPSCTLAAPTNLAASSPTTSAPSLSWNAVTGASSYNIYRNNSLIDSINSSSNPVTYTDSLAPLGTNSYYVTAVNSAGESDHSNTISVVYNGTLVAINSGGTTQGNFVADTDVSGGSSYTSANSVNTSNVTDPASEAVYQSSRYGNMTYTIPNLTPNSNYLVRLHFNELYWGTSNSGGAGGVGSRVFNVAINGTQVLHNFDIFLTAGGADKALVKQFHATADASGNITVDLSTVTDNALINGIEIDTPGSDTPPQVSSLSLNAGGIASGSFLSDDDYSGGLLYSTTASVDTSGVTNPAPQAVYQTCRYGNMTYTVPNLIPNASYTVKLHFNELYWGTALAGGSGGNGSRVFNVSLNGTNVLNNFDIYQTAGGANKAVVESFTTNADSNGKITIDFTGVTDNPMVNGIELSH